MSFIIGQKVVCIKDFKKLRGRPDGSGLHRTEKPEWFPTKGEIYTIKALKFAGHLMLEESPNQLVYDKNKFELLKGDGFVQRIISSINGDFSTNKRLHPIEL